jgi:hypothetical protein
MEAFFRYTVLCICGRYHTEILISMPDISIKYSVRVFLAFHIPLRSCSAFKKNTEFMKTVQSQNVAYFKKNLFFIFSP